VEHGDDCALNPGGAVVSSFKIGLYGCPDLSVCTRSRVVVDRDPRPPLAEGGVHAHLLGGGTEDGGRFPEGVVGARGAPKPCGWVRPDTRGRSGVGPMNP